MLIPPSDALCALQTNVNGHHGTKENCSWALEAEKSFCYVLRVLSSWQKFLRIPFQVRARLRAGVLAAYFAFLTVLPWLHVMLDHQEPGCLATGVVSCVAESDAVSISAQPIPAPSCWVCQRLAALLELNDRPGCLADFSSSLPLTRYYLAVPEAYVLAPVNPAHRSTAPPAV